MLTLQEEKGDKEQRAGTLGRLDSFAPHREPCFCERTCGAPSHLCQPAEYTTVYRKIRQELQDGHSATEHSLEDFPEIVRIDSDLMYMTPLEQSIAFNRQGDVNVICEAFEEEAEVETEKLLQHLGNAFPARKLPALKEWPPLWVHVGMTEDGHLFPSSPRLSQAEAVLAAKLDVLCDREEEDDHTNYVVGRLRTANLHRLIIGDFRTREIPYIGDTPLRRLFRPRTFEAKVHYLQLAECYRRSQAIRTYILLRHSHFAIDKEVCRIVLDFLFLPDWEEMLEKVWIDDHFDERDSDASIQGTSDRFHPEQVIDIVQHAEPAAHIEPDEAAELESQRWAQTVELNMNAAADTMEAASEATFTHHLLLLSLRRHPPELAAALSGAQSLEPCRHALGTSGLSVQLPCQAFVFVEPHQYRIAVDCAMDIMNGELRPFHIVTSERYEEAIMEIINGLPSRMNVRVRSATEIYTPHRHEVVRTFIHVPLRLLRNEDSVTQSTSEAVHRAQNPRR